jgi:hypothetical protein
MCRGLVPGVKPYYQLATDGSLVGQPKEMLSGCSEIEEKIELYYDTGMISLFAFVSSDGNIGKKEPVSFSVKIKDNKKGIETIPMISPVSLDEKLIKYVEKFQIYVQNIKVDKP